MEEKAKELLVKQQYRFAGESSAVKICSWTKNSIRGRGVCYKEQFYGIRCHRCVQMTPALGYCHNRCIFCWRPVEFTKSYPMKGYDDPDKIIDNCLEAQKELLTGFFGNENADKKKLEESMQPRHFAISLSGEPTLYPMLGSLIRKLHKRGYSTFLVTNGMQPDVLEGIEPPTQLYLSVDAPNKELFERIDKPAVKDGWSRLNKSLEIIRKLGDKTRTCLRFTMMEGINMTDPQGWAAMIEKARPWFVEVKAYMYVGCSKDRMKIENMPSHAEVMRFSEQLSELSGYALADEHERSRVVLLEAGKAERKIRWQDNVCEDS